MWWKNFQLITGALTGVIIIVGFFVCLIIGIVEHCI